MPSVMGQGHGAKFFISIPYTIPYVDHLKRYIQDGEII
jgi:hypothetical protein